MKKKLLENISKPIKLFKENGGIVGCCEKGGKFLGQTLKGIFNVARFVVEPPVSAVILAGLITVDYLKKEEDKPLYLVGDSTQSIKITSIEKTVDLEIELKDKKISKGAKKDIEELFEMNCFDEKLFINQYKKKIKQYHPDSPDGSESLFKEFKKLSEEIRWKWFIDMENLDPEDKRKFELQDFPELRHYSYLYIPKYKTNQRVGIIKIIKPASCADDLYYCRDMETKKIVELTEQELATHDIQN
jgi:hypothetical protein